MNRILLAGDWHGNQSHARRSIDRAVKVGAAAILQLGDFGYWEHVPEGVRFLDKLERYAAAKRIPVYFLDGNHDKISLLLERYSAVDDEGFTLVRDNVRYARRGHRWNWGGSRFLALGGAYSTDKDQRLLLESLAERRIATSNAFRPPERAKPSSRAGTLWFPEEQMTAAEFTAALGHEPVDIIAAHDKPRGSEPDYNRKKMTDSWPNQDRLQLAIETLRPALFVHGHLHWRYTQELRTTWGATRVEGLGAEPDAREPGRRYPTDDSWLVLDLPLADSG